METTTIGSNIRALRKAKGLRQIDLAVACEVSNITISNWETDKFAPHMENPNALCNALDCTEADILGFYYPQPITPAPSPATAPVAGRIAAGDPREAIELTGERHYIDPAILERYPDGFFLLVQGDSMDKVLPDGCYAYIARGEFQGGDICAVKVNGDEATIKRVYLYDGLIVLQPESFNPAHKRKVLDASDPDAPAVAILGRVVWYDCTL